MTGKFQRSPSKIWWDLGNNNNGAGWRSASSNSGSQDSGFSDTENSPKCQKLRLIEKNILEKSIKKGAHLKHNLNQQNLSCNVKEKSTSQKSISMDLHRGRLYRSLDSTSRYFNKKILVVNTDPVTRVEQATRSNKVKRSLFDNNGNSNNFKADIPPDQYSKQHSCRTRENLNISNGSNVTTSASYSWSSNDSLNKPSSLKTLPLLPSSHVEYWPVNLSAPAIISEEEASTSFNVSSEGSDSELESLFRQDISSPRHTSTPKSYRQGTKETDLHRKYVMNLRIKFQQNERVPPVVPDGVDIRADVQQWIRETKLNYESECMTALQCKSIAKELAEKVNQLAFAVTLTIRDLLNYKLIIEREFENLKQQKNHIKSLSQSLCGLILEFLSKYSLELDSTLHHQCESINHYNENDLNKILAKVHDSFKVTYKKILKYESKKFIDDLGDPSSDIHLRAMLTGLTSIALRNEELITLFSMGGAIQTLVILCEKCDGSSIHTLSLRALTTLCSNANAIQCFVRSQGLHLIADSLIENERPEPERSEAIALLAQITAPWIEDTQGIVGLADFNTKFIKALAQFASSTKCCQNLLLCSAALANLTTMDTSCIRFVLNYKAVDIFLKAIKRRGPRVSVYLLEQTAIILANVSSIQEGKIQLIENEALAALLCFLQTPCLDDEIIKRLQQKSMVALSRLCSEPEAAKEIVKLGGLNRLIQLCRDKNERCNSDAVLVAALVTLRKIIEACGKSVISAEDAQELVEPRLLDSFLAYSTQNESYV